MVSAKDGDERVGKEAEIAEGSRRKLEEAPEEKGPNGEPKDDVAPDSTLCNNSSFVKFRNDESARGVEGLGDVAPSERSSGDTGTWFC